MSNEPLANLLRPKTFDDIVGQKHLLGKDATFRNAMKKGKVPNMIFYGPPGTGKTTVANIIASNCEMSFFKLNATTATTDDIKNIIKESTSLLNSNGVLLYLDEIQYFNKKQQQSLLEFVESGQITLIAATTENPYFYIYPALISRCMVFEFKAISTDEIAKGIQRANKFLSLKMNKDAINLIANASNGDMRKALNYLEFISLTIYDKSKTITKKQIEDVIDKAHISYDRSEDKHYDHLSALMKSLRGSDPDAAIFYLAKMLEAGDINSVCRRLLCSANEDVGLAYPSIIPIVKAAVDTALQLGLPEAYLPLSNAVILIATAPKSNSSCLAYLAAAEDVRQGKGINIPRCLQNNHYDGDDAKIKGQNYKYPHDYPNHYVKQQYLPDDIKSAKYYVYQDNKYESALKQYWEKIIK